MTAHQTKMFLAALVAAFLTLTAVAGAVTPSPVWRVETLALPTNLVPGASNRYEVRAVNVTGGPLGSGPVTLTNTLPDGLSVERIDLSLATPNDEGGNAVNADAANEVQQIAVRATGGTFSLSFEGDETGALPFDATAGEVEDALAALASVGTGNVAVSGGPGNEGGSSPYVVTFSAGLSHRNVATLEARSDLLTGGEHKATVSTTTPGGGVCELSSPGAGDVVTCKVPTKLQGLPISREAFVLRIDFGVPTSLEGQELTNVSKVEGAGAAPHTFTRTDLVSSEVAPSGLNRFETELLNADGTPTVQAGARPYLFTTSFELNTEPSESGNPIPARGDLRNIHVTLPPGLIGDPTASGLCDPQDFANFIADGNLNFNQCPASSVVGVLDSLAENGIRLSGPVFNLTPPPGMPALLGFQVAGFPFYVETELGPGPDHPIVSNLESLTQIQRPISGRLTLWGTPGDSSHDGQRTGHCFSIYGTSNGTCPAGIDPKAFLRMPTSCGASLPFQMLFDTWLNPGTLLGSTVTAPAPQGCAQLSFSPTISVTPHSTVADTPSGLAVNLHVPQNDDPELLATPDLRDATVQLPKGVTVNPASASGLAACSSAQIDLHSTNPPTCPEAAKLGSLEVNTPLLDHPAPGSVYLAAQGDNPFRSLLAIYMVVDDPQSGVVLKLAGKVDPDPKTGQLSTTFSNNPQVPFEDLRVVFFDGPRAALRMPPSCGTYTTHTDLRPWSAPESGPNATPTDSFTVDSGPGGPCPSGQIEPKLEAGVDSAIAGSYSPFRMRLSRADGTAELSRVTVSPPTGLLANLSGIPYCAEGAIAQAEARRNPGEGAAEQAAPSCTPASQVGQASVGVGAGPLPLYVSGKLHLAGPYRGAPLSLVAVVPAVTGPFDLGVVVNRVALHVDSRTAQVTAASDPFPLLLSGIPVDLRDLRVSLDRAGFTLAPTSCEKKSVQATAFGAAGGSSPASAPFQVGACKALGFSPKLALRMSGASRRGAHPALRATLKTRAGDANIARTEVIMPRAVFIDQAHINNPCTRVQFEANACPKKSILGKARAFTPLLDEPLEGPVYFRSNGGERELPDIVADLHGQIDVTLVGFIDSVGRKGSEVSRLRTTFAQVPDAPVSKFVLSLAGGKRGLLVLSRGICKGGNRATLRMRGQNGRSLDRAVAIKRSCGVSR